MNGKPTAPLGKLFEVFQEGLGSIFKVFQQIMENPRLLLENLFSMYVGHASGWAGGVTRSVKNYMR